jgi:hypothetical protein
MRSGDSTRQLEELLGAVAEALARACARDPKLRGLLGEVTKAGLEVRVVLRPKLARPGSSGFSVEIQSPWSRGWSLEDREALHALGIALEEHEQGCTPPEPDGHSHR